MYFNDVFDKDKLKTEGNDHLRYIKICLQERADLVRDVLLDMDRDFTGHFTRGKSIPDAICRSKAKCKELLDYAYSYLNWHTSGPTSPKRQQGPTCPGSMLRGWNAAWTRSIAG